MKRIIQALPTCLIAVAGAFALLVLQARLDPPPPADPCKTSALPHQSNGLLTASHHFSCGPARPEMKA